LKYYKGGVFKKKKDYFTKSSKIEKDGKINVKIKYDPENCKKMKIL